MAGAWALAAVHARHTAIHTGAIRCIRSIPVLPCRREASVDLLLLPALGGAAPVCAIVETTRARGNSFLADRHLGLRHRAAIGATEESDAVALVVSEERGSISIALSGRIIRDIEADRLESILSAFFSHKQRTTTTSLLQRWRTPARDDTPTRATKSIRGRGR